MNCRSFSHRVDLDSAEWVSSRLQMTGEVLI